MYRNEDANQEYRIKDVNIITENDALVTDCELSGKQNLILATIYCES